jgi:dipeptidyl aminopeptidase/acylaminoacyl peptidase
VIIYDLEKKLRYYLAPEWDRSPDNAVWSKDDTFLYLTAHDLGRAKVFALAVPDTPSNLTMDAHVPATPVALTSDGFATAVQPLADGRLVFTKNTTSTPNEVFLLTPTSLGSLTLGQNKEERLTSFADAALKGKHTAPPEEMWFSGAEDRQVHSWVAFPPGYDKNSDKKYPVSPFLLYRNAIAHRIPVMSQVIMLVHGGAQMAWNDQWSTRFSVQVWAGQGYMCVWTCF